MMKTLFDAKGLIPETRPETKPTGPGETFWEVYDKISPVAVAYRRGGGIYVQEINTASRLLKLLWSLGRQEIPIRGLICGQGAANALSLAALNCYLHHLFGRQSYRTLRTGNLHRFTWYDIQQDVPLRWER